RRNPETTSALFKPYKATCCPYSFLLSPFVALFRFSLPPSFPHLSFARSKCLQQKNKPWPSKISA
ncbi:hypothetical protein NDU88_000364, partial [Pleurodeles waltl]